MNHELLKPYKFKLNWLDYDNIVNELIEVINKPQSFIRKLFDDSRKINMNELSYWSILQNEITKNIDIDFTNRRIDVSNKTNIDFITEMSIYIIINLYDESDDNNNSTNSIMYLENYGDTQEENDKEIVYKQELILEPSECLVVKPNSYIKNKINNKKHIVICISPKYDSYGLIAYPKYDEIFLQKE